MIHLLLITNLIQYTCISKELPQLLSYKLLMKSPLDETKPKYDKLLTTQELQFLQYDKFVEDNQFEYVYEPNDDTFLILSTLKYEIKDFPQDVFLCEVGSGSGVISANVNNWLTKLDRPPLLHISIDINMDASVLSSKYYSFYNLNIQQINTSLFNNFAFEHSALSIKPDVIIFNPPYVPVEQEQLDNQHKYLVQKLRHVKEKRKCVRKKQQNMIAYSYMGGLDGLAVTRKIIARVNWSCVLYFIVMGKQGLQSIDRQVNDGCGLNKTTKMEAVLQLMNYHQFYNEHLYVLKLTFNKLQ